MNLFQQFLSRIVGLDQEVEKRVEEEKRGWETVVIEAWRGNNASSAGANVTPGSSIQMAAVFACVQRISRDLASLPLLIYEKQDQSKRRSDDHILYELLNVQPNPKMTAYEFRETLQSHLLLWGNAYAQIIYDGSGQIRELWPLRPGGILMTEVRNGIKYYMYQNSKGEMNWISEEDIWHQHGLGDDGERGYSPITLMKRAIGLGMAAEEFGEKFFENDAWPGLILEHPGKLGDTAYQRLKEDVKEEHQGSARSHKPWILEEGLKLHELAIQPDHAQFLETRKFQVAEICRIFLVPPHKIMDLDRATFSNIEQQEIDYWTGSIRPWAVRWEKSIQTSLMMTSERSRYYAEHKLEGMLRGDTAARYQAYAVGRQNGWLSANDIRALENMEPIDGGDVYLLPMNMIPSDQIRGQPATITGGGNGNQRDANDQIASSGDILRLPRNDIEQRGRQAAAARQKLAGRQERVFRDVAGRILRRERNDIREKARKLIPDGKVDEFVDYVKHFYKGHAGWSADQILPVARTYAELVGDAVEQELDKSDLVDQIGEFVNAYADEFGKKESARSQEYLLNTVDKAPRNELQQIDEQGSAALLTDIENKLDEWVDTRPASVAHEETIRENNAVAVALYTIGGVTQLMSVATGVSSCPYCKNLDGKIIGIKDNFLTAGQLFNPAGAVAPMLVSHSKRHAPYHGGCDCMTVSA